MIATTPGHAVTRYEGDACFFEEHSQQLRAVVSRRVRTSAANIEDACALAWLQWVRHQPRGDYVFPWLCSTAIREAIKLHRRTSQTVGLDQLTDGAADRAYGPEDRLELIAAGQAFRQARLRPHERRLIALRVLGYSRPEMTGLSGHSERTIDRHLSRAQRRLRAARAQHEGAG